MLRFEPVTCRIGRFYKGVITKNVSAEGPIFFLNRFFGKYLVKKVKSIAYTRVQIRNLWLDKSTGPYKM